MKHRLAVVVATAAGLGAELRGQELVQVSYTWSEVIAGTLTPVSSPNSVLEPGEGARIGVNLFAMINGTNAAGQTTTYTPPPPPGVGTVRGIAAMFFNLASTGGEAVGTWSARAISPDLSAGAFTGTILNQGAFVDSFSGGQFIPTGGTAIGTNPVSDAWRGVWSPASYQSRTVNWKAQDGTASNSWIYATGVLVQYGSAFVDPSDPSTEYALYLTKYISRTYGSGVNIPISPLPAPGGTCVIAASATFVLRRRRAR